MRGRELAAILRDEIKALAKNRRSAGWRKNLTANE